MDKFKNHKLVIKNFVFTILPSIVFPIIDSSSILHEQSKTILIIFAVIFIIYFVFYFSLKEEKENQKMHENLAYYEKHMMSQKILNSLTEIEKNKRNLLKADTLPDYKKEVLLYNPHEFVEQICSNMKLLISNITEIALSFLSISFIYRYPEYNSKWQWITRKNSSINRELDDFINNDNFHSYFHYIITNNISSNFENNKENLVKEGHYWINENDKHYSTLGSIASYKMSFIKNESTLCVGYLVISTYGTKFVKENDEQKIANFNNLLTNNIIPSYRHLIESELGFMYERHDIMEHQKTSSVNIQTKIP